MNPENRHKHVELRHSCLWRQPLLYERPSQQQPLCHTQVAQTGQQWRTRNNLVQTRSHLQAQESLQHLLPRQPLNRTLALASSQPQSTKNMLKRLKTEAPDIQKDPQLVTGLQKLKAMNLLMAKDLHKVTYEGKRQPKIYNDYHTRETNRGYSRGPSGRFYTS